MEDDSRVREDAQEAMLAASRVMVGVALATLPPEAPSLAQFRLLFLLHEHGAMKATALAERLGVNASTVTRLGDRLVRHGYARRERDELDRRILRLEATDAGRELVERVLDARRREIRTILGRVDREDLPAMVRALRAVADDDRGFAEVAWAHGWSREQR